MANDIVNILTKGMSSDGGLQLSDIQLSEDYLREWNEGCRDFVVISRNGELVSNSIYRVGGLGTRNIEGMDYFMLLKYVEDFYPANILKMSQRKDPKHLSGRWCIIDKNGVEKVVFEQFKTPYLVRNSCIYHLDRKYYNIETGELYCIAYEKVESAEFLFLENNYDDDKTRRGVMKINKKTGTWEIFPK